MTISDEELKLVLSIINTTGVVGVLSLIVLAFVRGEIITKTVFDRVLSLYEKQLERMTEQFIERLDKIIERRNGNGGTGPLNK